MSCRRNWRLYMMGWTSLYIGLGLLVRVEERIYSIPWVLVGVSVSEMYSIFMVSSKSPA